MYMLIEDKASIAEAQAALEATIRHGLPKRVVRDIGYPGGTLLGARVSTDNRHWYWASDQKDSQNPRRLNWFGLVGRRTGIEITVEMNTTYVGRNNFVGGFFGRNMHTGEVYLFHSARVGGGTKGVKKEAFLAWARHDLVNVYDQTGSSREGVLVMPVRGTSAAQTGMRYVDSVADFKRAVREGRINTEEFREREQQYRDYYKEGRGRRRSKGRTAALDYVSRHGEVVDALEAWRRADGLAHGERIVKNVLIDLGVQTRGVLTEVYEVKTSIDRSDVYTAIGQLTVHAGRGTCKRVFVLPDDGQLPTDLNDGISRAGIILKRFRINEAGVELL